MILKVGLVGLGAVSGAHLRAIERQGGLARLAAVCDIDRSKSAKTPGIPFYTELEEMLKKEKLDCLHICLPHWLHGQAVSLAASYGVNVFVEKPAGLNGQEAQALKELAMANGIQAGVCFQNRYNPTTRKALELIRSGTYGRLMGCKAIVTWDRRQGYYDREPWRGRISQAGGGVMRTQAIHCLDLMRLFGGPVRWVKGMTGNLLLDELEVEDTACAQIRFENGAGGIFYGSAAHCCNSSVELELVLEKGVLVIQNGRLTLVQGKEEQVLARDVAAEGQKAYYGSGHDRAVGEFYQKLLGLGGSFVSLEEAEQTGVLIDRIMESSRKSKRVYWQ